MNDHHFTNTTDDTCAAALQGGCDLDCGGLLSQCAEAVTKKTRGLSEKDVETALVTAPLNPSRYLASRSIKQNPVVSTHL